jgi:hypothetical protein
MHKQFLDDGQLGTSTTKDPMRNPFMTRNPFMSAWLSSANTVMGAARAQGTAAAKRQVTSMQGEAARQVLDFWSGKWIAPAKRTNRKRR